MDASCGTARCAFAWSVNVRLSPSTRSALSVNGPSNARGCSLSTRTTLISTHTTIAAAARNRNASNPSTTANTPFVTDAVLTTLLT